LRLIIRVVLRVLSDGGSAFVAHGSYMKIINVSLERSTFAVHVYLNRDAANFCWVHHRCVTVQIDTLLPLWREQKLMNRC
jgi:hypothetical protein